MVRPTAAPSSSSSPASRAGQRAVLRTVRVRVVPNTRTPAALPCHNYFDVYPEEIGPYGNIVVHDEQELQAWLLVARPVTREHAEKEGGCIAYTPSTAKNGKRNDSGSDGNAAAVWKEAQYYCITDADDVVYGRGVYLPHPPRRYSLVAKRCSVDATPTSVGSCGCSDSASTVGEGEPTVSPTSVEGGCLV